MVAEHFVLKKAIEMSGVTIFKALKFGLIFISIAGICYGVYGFYFKKRPPTTTEYIEQKVEYNYPDDKDFFLGIKLFGFKLGISK